MNRMVEVGQVYKLVDANSPAFGKVKKIIEQQVWEEDCISSKLPDLAWGNWYQWVGEKVYCLHGAGFEVTRLIKATSEEIAMYEQKVAEYKERNVKNGFQV
ncbi:hypothetical protein ACMUVS_000673 [Enterococcus faecalis]|uniref:hypothetical protein n=1 Tax=Enterococcus TaxID=1350 RepID=UPI0004039A94|nr:MULTISPECIES: hypothetical protein [Enterococcus]MDQ8688897.1 hypothetical protein [Enterococcus sp. IsoGale005]MDT2226274.1 hypothetical protein [Enterococcus faecalis]